MAITVGTDAYISLADYKKWADARGYTYGTDDVVEAAIVIATDFMDATYTFRGQPVSDNQPLQLPTNEVAIADIEKAIAQAVYLQLLGRLTVDPSTLTTAVITGESKQVGSLATSTSYAERARYTTTYPTTSVDKLLRGFVVSQGLGSVARC